MSRQRFLNLEEIVCMDVVVPHEYPEGGIYG